MKNISALIIILFSLFQGYSQNPYTTEQIEAIANSGKKSEIIRQNSTLNQEDFHYFAGILADKLVSLDPENANFNYRKGFSLLKAKHDYQNAIPCFEKAAKNTSVNFDMYSSSEDKAPVDAIFHLATCYHLDGQIDKAIEKYNLFKSESKKQSELVAAADLRLQQCEVAKQLMANPVNVKVKNIGNVVNTDLPDYNSVISLDGSALYFTSRKPWENNESERYRDPATHQYKEDIYVSYMDFDSSWTEPSKLAFCKPIINEATSAVSSDERKIYVYQDTTGNGDMFESDFYESVFNDITPLKMKNLNTEYWENHAMMNHNEDLLFFTSDRPGGYGGVDIYVMRKKGGSWSAPENLGSNINGPEDESAPFVAVNDKTLYFATRDSRSMGGFDIMKSELQSDGTWSEAVNVGYPWNDTDDDLFFTTTIDGKKGYFTSQRKDGYGEKDIYEVTSDDFIIEELAVFKGVIRTADGSPVPEDFQMTVDLTCLDCDPSTTKSIYPKSRDGKFTSKIEPCKTYKVSYKSVKSGKIMGEDEFTTLCNSTYQEVYREVIIDIEKEEVITPKDPQKDYPDLEFMHYFAYNKNKLDVNEGELNEFVKAVEAQLKDGREDMTIKIFSSASHVPTATYETNEKLTKIRANNMKEDLDEFIASIGFSDKVKVEIETTLVQGPKYNQDFKNLDRYSPYQYVGMKLKNQGEMEAILKGMVRTADGSPLPKDFEMEAYLTCLDCNDKNPKTINPKNQNFTSEIEPCKSYEIKYKNVKSGKMLGEDTFSTLCDTPYQEVYREVIIDVEKDEMIIPEVTGKGYPELEFLHYFAYNKNKLNVNEGELNEFVKAVEAQMKDGRESMTITIFSSASHVPTATYKTNERLTRVRSNNMKEDLEEFVASIGFSDKVKVVIKTTLVQGPEYIKDFKNHDKYFPYQYVGMKTSR